MAEPALKLAGSFAPSVVRPTGRWITTAEAARRSGYVVGYINRLRQEEGWDQRGLARKVKLPSGQWGWEIDEGVDDKFASGKSPEQRAAEFDWNSIDKADAAKALARLKVLTALRAELDLALNNRRDGRDKLTIIDQFAARAGLNVAPRTIQRWDEKFRTEELPWSLLDGRVATPAETRTNSDFAPFYAYMEDWYLRQGEPRMSRCYQLARAQAMRDGVPVPCLRHAQRHFEAMSVGRKIQARLGPDAFDDKCAAYSQRDHTRIRIMMNGKPVVRAMESNDIWVADHHPCDVLVFAGLDSNGKAKFKRPWLSVWQDIRSRRWVGYRVQLTDPNAGTVLLTLRDAIINVGLQLPRYCYTDNGRDYDAWFWDGLSKRDRRLKLELNEDHYTGIYTQLGIGHLHAQPYNAKAKDVERWFREFEEGFNVFQPTYTGRNPQEKPEQLAAALRPRKSKRQNTADLPELLKAGKAPRFEDWAREASTFIEDVLMKLPSHGHGMDGYSPAEVYDANVGIATGQTRPIQLPHLDCLLQLVNKPVKVGRNGIRVDKRTYGQHDPALRQLFEREVLLRIDPNDVRFATVWTVDGQKRLCTVQENELSLFDVTPDPVYREALVATKRHNRQLKEVSKRGMRRIESPVDLMRADAEAELRKRQAERPLPEPPPATGMQMVNAGFDHASIGDQTAFKMAAGAESVRHVNSTLAQYAEDDE